MQINDEQNILYFAASNTTLSKSKYYFSEKIREKIRSMSKILDYTNISFLCLFMLWPRRESCLCTSYEGV
jgi:hypothetical protein